MKIEQRKALGWTILTVLAAVFSSFMVAVAGWQSCLIVVGVLAALALLVIAIELVQS